MKTCTRCKKTKSLNKFSLNKGLKGGFYSRCKLCKASEQRLYVKRNWEKVNKRRYGDKAGTRKNKVNVMPEISRLKISGVRTNLTGKQYKDFWREQLQRPRLIRDETGLIIKKEYARSRISM